MSSAGRKGPRVLFLPLEFTFWPAALHLAYTAQLGLEEGLAAQDASVLTIPSPWLEHARAVCRDEKFDQVWLEVSHHGPLSPEWAEWVAERAPVRLGFALESLGYTPGELVLNPKLREMRGHVERWLPYLTHLAAVDEVDAEELDSGGRVRSVWWPQAVPERSITEDAFRVEQPYGTFAGSGYGERRVWLDRPDLEGLLVRQPPSERGTPYPALFNGLHRCTAVLLRRGARPERVLPAYLRRLRWLRVRCFACWLVSMRRGCAVVNLPAYVKTYAGRVTEAMAAGRPLLTWEVPGRPRTRALFEDGKEILLYPRSEPAGLAERLRRIVREPQFGAEIVENARRKLRRFHTVEHRVRQLFDWITDGTPPAYE